MGDPGVKRKLVVFFIVATAALMLIAFSWTTAGKFSIYPFQEFSVLNKNGLNCGKGRFHTEVISFVQRKLYVGSFEDSSNPKGYEFSLLVGQRKINIYRTSDGFSIAEERGGKLEYGWSSKGFPIERLALLCEKSSSVKN